MTIENRTNIAVEGQKLLINMIVTDANVVSLIADAPEEDREIVLSEILSLGAMAFKTVRISQDAQRFERAVSDASESIQREVGGLPDKILEELDSMVGPTDSKLSRNIRTILEDVQKGAQDAAKQIRDEVVSSVDPTQPDSKMAIALGRVMTLVDPKNRDSIQAKTEDAVKSLALPNGAIASTVKQVAEEALKPLREDLQKLRDKVLAEEVKAEEATKGTKKGRDFEEGVVLTSVTWASANGAEVEHTGVDNKAGDVLIELRESGPHGLDLRIAIEAKDDATRKGRRQITQLMESAMVMRRADAGIYVGKSGDCFANEIIECDTGVCGSGPWIACTHECLPLALKLTVIEKRLRARAAASDGVDISEIQRQVQAVRTSLRQLTTVRTNMTQIEGSTKRTVGICTDLQRDIEGALSAIEGAIMAEDPMIA